MNQRRSNTEIARLLGLTTAVVAVSTLYFAQAVLVPLALALFLSLILTPLVRRLEKLHLPRGAAVLLVVSLAISGAVFLAVVITNQLLDVTTDLPTYSTNIEKKLAFLHDGGSGSVARAITALSEVAGDIGRTLPATNRPEHPKTSRIAKNTSSSDPVDVRVVTPPVSSMESALSFLARFTIAIVVLVFTIFILLRAEDLRGRFIRLVGHNHLNAMTRAMEEASQRISRYLLLQFVVNLSYGVVIYTALRLIGLPNALLWGGIAAVFRFLPYIGPPIGGLLPVLFSLAVFDGWHRSLVILGLFVIVETLVANFIEPLLYAANTGISSLAILAAAVFWTVLWGPVGLLLSTPLTVCLVVLGRYVPQLEFLHVVLGDEPVLTPAVHFYQRLLASDLTEAREILDEALKIAGLLEVYDSIVLPALGMLQQHRQRNDIEDEFAELVVQNARYIVEELNEEHEEAAPVDAGNGIKASSNGEPGFLSIICVPTKTNGDEIVAIMLAQVLERRGNSVQCLPLKGQAEIITQVSQSRPGAVIVSALQPQGLMPVRKLSAEIRSRLGRSTVIVGLWNFEGDSDSVWARFGMDSRPIVVTTMAEAVDRIGMLRGPSSAVQNPDVVASH